MSFSLAFNTNMAAYSLLNDRTQSGNCMYAMLLVSDMYIAAAIITQPTGEEGLITTTVTRDEQRSPYTGHQDRSHDGNITQPLQVSFVR